MNDLASPAPPNQERFGKVPRSFFLDVGSGSSLRAGRWADYTPIERDIFMVLAVHLNDKTQTVTMTRESIYTKARLLRTYECQTCKKKGIGSCNNPSCQDGRIKHLDSVTTAIQKLEDGNVFKRNLRKEKTPTEVNGKSFRKYKATKYLFLLDTKTDFLMIPARIIEDGTWFGLTNAEKAVLPVLACLVGVGGGVARNVSSQDVIPRARIRKDYYSAAIAGLQSKGLIHATRVPGGGYDFTLTDVMKVGQKTP